MLTSLLIKDYALIDNVTIRFDRGFNVITGETGAGKSILIGALGLVLGERANTEIVRKGALKSVVEGIFDVEEDSAVNRILEENDIEIQPEMIVRREVSLKGSNRCFLNDTPVPLSVVKDVGNKLVDLHGQHEHQSLLRIENHIDMLDLSGDITNEFSEFDKLRHELTARLKELKELNEKEKSIREKRDLYEFQINEIDAVSPVEGEEEELEEELKILENSEKLISSSTSLYSILYEGENTVYDNLVSARDIIYELAEIDKSFNEKCNEANSALANIEDIAQFVRSYRDKIDLEPVRLDEVRERLGAFNMLKKKYGGSIDKVIKYRKNIGEEFDLAENFSRNIEQLSDKIEILRRSAGKAAEKLSAKRKKIAQEIIPAVEESLKYLGIADSKFEVRFETEKPSDSDKDFIVTEKGEKLLFDKKGIDKIEFYISTNAGEDPKPLARVASGGEISRVMLSLKTILAKNDKLPLLVFDEIDTGVSGRIALKTGQTMKSLASVHQIIAITHLPQIAALADHHFVVEKNKIDNRVVSGIRKLTSGEQVTEVAKLISGEELTDASLSSARELMNNKK